MNKDLAVVCLTILIGLTISGCHPSRLASWDLHGSKADYKNCLKAYPNEDSKCEGLRKLYEIDKDTVDSHTGNKTNVKIEQ